MGLVMVLLKRSMNKAALELSGFASHGSVGSEGVSVWWVFQASFPDPGLEWA